MPVLSWPLLLPLPLSAALAVAVLVTVTVGPGFAFALTVSVTVGPGSGVVVTVAVMVVAGLTLVSTGCCPSSPAEPMSAPVINRVVPPTHTSTRLWSGRVSGGGGDGGMGVAYGLVISSPRMLWWSDRSARQRHVCRACRRGGHSVTCVRSVIQGKRMRPGRTEPGEGYDLQPHHKRTRSSGDQRGITVKAADPREASP